MGSLGDYIDTIVSGLTLEEKVSLLSGKNMWETKNIDRVNIPSLKTTDGPAGVRGEKWIGGAASTFIPCGISMAASFDPASVEKVAIILGKEAKLKGSSVLLAPTINMSRSPLGGRNFENFGEDPFLTGSIASAIVSGVQSQGVGACIKHFVANDMETRRYNIDETIDERTLREVYLRPFEIAIHAARPWSVMTSYQKINGKHTDTSQYLVKDILRGEWGFDGVVMSDWGGCNDTVKSLTATMDLEMPGPPVRRGAALVQAVNDGLLDERTEVDPSVRRILRLLQKAKLFPAGKTSNPTNGANPTSSKMREQESGSNEEFQTIVREAAASSLVLLKNDSILPLKPGDLDSVAVIGPHAKKPTAGGSGSASVNPYYIATPYDSLVEQLTEVNPNIDIQHASGLPGSRVPPILGKRIISEGGLRMDFYAGHEFQGEIVGTRYWKDSQMYLMSDGDVPEPLIGQPYCYRVTGTIASDVTGPHVFGLMNTGKAKLYIDDSLVIDNEDWTETSGSFMGCASQEKQNTMDLIQGQSYHIRVDNVAVPPPVKKVDNTLFKTVSGLRIGLSQNHDQTKTMREAVDVAAKASCTVVVVGLNADEEKEGGDRSSLHLPTGMDELIEAVSGVCTEVIVVIQSACAVAMPWADKVHGIVQAWYQGQENGNALADCLLGKTNFSGKLPVTFPKRIEDHGSHPFRPDAAHDKADYGEGIMIGYRHFDKAGIEPMWPFGFGLSYTTFQISDIQSSGSVSPTRHTSAIVSARVTNTGSCDGHEVVQAYVAPSPSIASLGLEAYERALGGFRKVFVPEGKTVEVQIEISADSIRWFDVQGGGWRTDPGSYNCWVGTSSRDMVGRVQLRVQE